MLPTLYFFSFYMVLSHLYQLVRVRKYPLILKELETLTRQDIERQKERLLTMYIKELITYEELMFYLNKLDEPLLKEPPTIY